MTTITRAIRLGSGPSRFPEDTAPTIPYRDLSELLKEAIEDALREAWKTLPAEAAAQGISLEDAAETPINRLLRDELEKLRTDPNRPIAEFNDDVFSYVTGSDELPDCTGKPFDENTNKPDLVIRPVKPPPGVARPITYGMHIECKIIEGGHSSRTLASYCNKGILRFIEGEYASTMPSAMMVAYLRRTEESLPASLSNFFGQESSSHFEVQAYPALNSLRTNQQAPLGYLSKHGRSKAQVGALQRLPGPIEIVHLWFEVKSTATNSAPPALMEDHRTQ